MKKVILCVLVVLTIALCSCSTIRPDDLYDLDACKVATLRDWSFQYNDETNDYSLFFSFSDKDGDAVTSAAAVDIRIVNASDEVVFQGTKSVTKDDFDYYLNNIRGEMYLANLKIPASEIKPGTSAAGKIYFTVYRNNQFSFEECSCEIPFDLPIQDITVVAESLPVELTQKNCGGYVESKIRIDEITCKTDSKSYAPRVNVIIQGEKIDGDDSLTNYDTIRYKLYDSEGYIVHSGTVYLDFLSVGDKFRDDSLVLYELVPGETYTLKFSDIEW